jgi:hypothetical protein
MKLKEVEKKLFFFSMRNPASNEIVAAGRQSRKKLQTSWFVPNMFYPLGSKN